MAGEGKEILENAVKEEEADLDLGCLGQGSEGYVRFNSSGRSNAACESGVGSGFGWVSDSTGLRVASNGRWMSSGLCCVQKESVTMRMLHADAIVV